MALFVALLVLACVAPFILLISSSFSSESSLVEHGYKFFPSEFSLEAYKYLQMNLLYSFLYPLV